MPMTERSCSCASCSCRLKKKDQGRANPPKKVNTHKVLKKIFIFMFWYSFLSIAAQKLHINMVVRCCVKNCKRNNKDDKEHSFFSFPSDPKITKKWLEFYGTKNVCGYQRICSDHFEEKCFKKIYPRRLLWNDAIPTINTANLSSSENRLEEDVISNYDIEQEQPSNETTEANHRVEKPIDILMTSDMIQITSKNPRRLLRNDAIPTINTRNLSSSENRLEEDVISNNYDIEQEQPSNEIAEANHRVETPIDILMTSDMIQITNEAQEKVQNSTNESTSYNASEFPSISTATFSRKNDTSKCSKDLQSCHTNSDQYVDHNSQLILTPKTLRLRKQKKIIASLRSKINRLSKVKNNKSQYEKHKVKIQKIIEESATFLPKEAHILLKTQLSLSMCNKYGRRFDNNFKDIALSILYHSPKTYRFLKKIITLPSERTLREYQKRFPICIGLNEIILSELKHKFENVATKNKVVSLLFDEINLVAEVHYDPHTDEMIGLADDGNIREPIEAKSALVCMVTWIHLNVKQVLGYWFLGSKDNANKTHDIILTTVEAVMEIGLIVKCIISDQGPRNQGLLKKLLITPVKPYFERNGHKIYIICDPPHLIKSMRNNVRTNKLLYKNGVVDWQEIEKVYKLSQENPLNLIPKISDKHFNLTHFSKMKVSLATQIFSESMYTAYLIYKTMFPDYFRKDNDTTLQFIIDMDKLFDTLNSSLKRKTVPNKLNYAITKDTKHREFLQNILEALENSRFEIGPQPACRKGFLLTINAVLQLFKDLNENYDIHELCTRKLNQDPLENLFSVIRQQHGCSVNPSPKQFQAGLRHIFITHLSKVSSHTNCEADKNYIFTKLNQLKHTMQSNKQKQRINEQTSSILTLTEINLKELNESLCIDSETKQFTESNAIYYISGYLAKKFLAYHVCTACEELLVLNNNTEYHDHKLFALMKTYTDSSLVYVTENVFQIIMGWEKQFKCVIRDIIHEKNLGKLITNILKDNCPIVQLYAVQNLQIPFCVCL